MKKYGRNSKGEIYLNPTLLNTKEIKAIEQVNPQFSKIQADLCSLFLNICDLVVKTNYNLYYNEILNELKEKEKKMYYYNIDKMINFIHGMHFSVLYRLLENINEQHNINNE